MGGLATKPQKKIEEPEKVLLFIFQSADLPDIQGFKYLNALEMLKIT